MPRTILFQLLIFISTCNITGFWRRYLVWFVGAQWDCFIKIKEDSWLYATQRGLGWPTKTSCVDAHLTDEMMLLNRTNIIKRSINLLKCPLTHGIYIASTRLCQPEWMNYYALDVLNCNVAMPVKRAPGNEWNLKLWFKVPAASNWYINTTWPRLML